MSDEEKQNGYADEIHRWLLRVVTAAALAGFAWMWQQNASMHGIQTRLDSIDVSDRYRRSEAERAHDRIEKRLIDRIERLEGKHMNHGR